MVISKDNIQNNKNYNSPVKTTINYEESTTNIFISCTLGAFGQDLDCKKFKNGKFIIYDEKVGNCTIERKGSTQVEYGEKSRFVLEFKVKWLDACTYELRLNKILENPDNVQFPPEGHVLTVEIIETKENSYIQKSTSNMYDMVQECELVKLN